MLANVPDRWRCLFATALYTGMRKGELLGLRKEDVDLGARLITIRRSHDRDTTKGGHADAIPIAAELAALPRGRDGARRRQSLVFPGRDGRLLSRRVQLEQVLRRALRRANILTGYRHSAAARAAATSSRRPTASIRRCPKCRMKLWPVGQVRPIRFHHIRHTTASLLMMAGADLPAVQRIMRHTDPRITTEFYGHLAPGYLRSAIDRLAFDPSEPAEPRSGRQRPRHRIRPRRRYPPVCCTLAADLRKTGDPARVGDSEKRSSSGDLVRAGYRVRTDDIQLGKLTLYQLS